MRVLVCGSRTLGAGDDKYVEFVMMYEILDALHATTPVSCVIEGGAKGADAIAGEWAYARHLAHEVYPADWVKHGKAAGFIRNQQMMDEGKPDVVVAFTDKPLNQSRGTSNMVGIAVRAGVKIWSIEL